MEGRAVPSPKVMPSPGSYFFFRPIFHPKGEVDIVVDFGFFDLTEGVILDEMLEGLEVVVLERMPMFRRRCLPGFSRFEMSFFPGNLKPYPSAILKNRQNQIFLFCQ